MDDCFCPKTGKKRAIGATYDYLNKVARSMPPWMLPTMRLYLPVVLTNPDCVWEGVREPDMGESMGYCYSKHFANKVAADGSTYPNKLGHVFSVYVNSDFFIYEVRWDEAEADTNGVRCPMGHDKRFGKRVK